MYNSLSNRLSNIEWEISQIKGDVEKLEDETQELRDENNGKELPGNTVYDELKTNFLKDVSNRYSLEDLQEIFKFKPGKGIQLKLKRNG